MNRELYISDIHFEYENKSAWKLFLKVIREIDPHIIYLGGDILDCYGISDFDRDPTRAMGFQAECDYASERLLEVRELAPGAEIFFEDGNHEYRLNKYLLRKAPELFSLNALRFPELLHFKDLRIKHIPYGKDHLIGDLLHTHGDQLRGGQYHAKAKMGQLNRSVIYGHYHNFQVFNQRVHGTFNHFTAWGNACMCDLNPHWDYFPNWINGFSLVEYDRNKKSYVQQIRVEPTKKGSFCMLAGDRVEV